MDRAHTSHVIRQFDLIPGSLSKEILRTVLQLKGRRKKSLSIPIDPATLSRLRDIYDRYLPRCTATPKPRHLPFYLALQDRYPNLNWDITDYQKQSSGTKQQVVLHLPRIQGVLPSLAALLLQDLQFDHTHRRSTVPEELTGLPANLRDDFLDLLDTTHAVTPKGEALRDMAGMLMCGLSGEVIIAVCPVCPDYEAEPTGNEDEPYRYTFSGIGEGIGLVAGRLLEDLPRYAEFFRRHNIDCRFLVAQGDFEAFSTETLTSVGVAKEEFLRRLKRSGERLNERLQGLPARTVFFTQFCGGESGWHALHAEMHDLMLKLREDPGASEIDWERTMAARRPLYQRWLGPSATVEHLMPFLLHQAAEYAAMGAIAHRVAPNSFLLCCDHSAMAPFYKVPHSTPVIYLKRNYV